jgi:hypothetical protein
VLAGDQNMKKGSQMVQYMRNPLILTQDVICLSNFPLKYHRSQQSTYVIYLFVQHDTIIGTYTSIASV